MVAKLCSPNGPSAYTLSRETGIPTPTLYLWKKRMGGVLLAKNKRSQDWTPEEIIEILFETKSLSDEELGKYLREKGLHSHDLEEWKESLSNSTTKKKGRPKLDPELMESRVKIKELERNIRRKDRALAETHARLVLQKKMQEIWGTGDEDEEQD